MKKAIITLAFSICLASLAWAGEGSVTWNLSQLVGTFSNATTIKATDSDAELTIVSGTFREQEYQIGSAGKYTDKISKGYTENAVIRVPVSSADDRITITGHYSCYIEVSCYYNKDYENNIWEAGSQYTDETYSKTFTPKENDLKNGYVTLTCKTNSLGYGTFFTSISVFPTTLVINDGTPFRSAVDFTVTELTFKRTFTNDGGMYTLMVPFDITNPSEYGTFYEYASHSGETVTLNEVATPRANTPYIFKPAKDFTEIRQTNTKIHATTGLSSDQTVGLHGTYEQITAPEGGYGYSAGDVSGISAGEFVRIGTNVTLPPYRAYLWLGETSAVRLRAEFCDLNDDDATAIESVPREPSAASSQPLTLTGQVATPGYKGIVIINGKKQLIH